MRLTLYMYLYSMQCCSWFNGSQQQQPWLLYRTPHCDADIKSTFLTVASDWSFLGTVLILASCARLKYIERFCMSNNNNYHCQLLTWVQAMPCMHTSLASQRVIVTTRMHLAWQLNLELIRSHCHPMMVKSLPADWAYRNIYGERGRWQQWPSLTIFATVPKAHAPRVNNTYILYIACDT